MFKRRTVAKGVNQARLSAETILTVYSDIGYDAVAVGPRDLAGRLPLLLESKKNGFPWVSANITDKNDRLLFVDVIAKEIQRQNIVITAVSNTPERAIPGVYIKSWKDVLPPLFKQIKAENPVSFIILLSSLSNAENKQIAEKFPEISLLIGADPTKGNISPALTNNSILTQTAKQGKYQGLLQITFGNSRAWGKDSREKLAALQNQLGSLNWQLRRLLKKSKTSDMPEKYSATIIRLEKEKKNLGTAITSMERQATEEQKKGSTTDQFTHSFLALKKNMPNDPSTEKQIKKLNSAIRSLNKKKEETKKTTKQEYVLQTPQILIGSNTCYACHELQGDFWKTTHHAKAYDTLVNKNRNLDLDCLPCHMTIDIPGGKFDSLIVESLLSYPEELQSVGCETCHGNGQKHMQDPERFKLVRTPGENICLTCHTNEHDDNFRYQVKLNKITCPAE